LIGPEQVLKGIAEVKTGKTFCLSLPLHLPGNNVLSPVRFPHVFVLSSETMRPTLIMNGDALTRIFSMLPLTIQSFCSISIPPSGTASPTEARCLTRPATESPNPSITTGTARERM
jgi:hypothetical protein